MSVTKICFVINSLQPGGMERVMSHLIHYMSRKSCMELHLVLYGRNRNIFYDLPDNIKIHKPDFQFNNNTRTWHSLKTLLFLRKRIKKINPDSILSFGEFWNNFVLLALLGTPYPVYVSDRCQPDKPFGWIQHYLRKYLYPKAAGVIVQSEQACRIYEDHFANTNILKIGNPIPEINTKSENERENIVLTVGRLISTKHHYELISLFAEINESGWRLVIVGDDALKQQNRHKLEALINEQGLQDIVELAGEQKNVEAYYRRSRLFAFPSSSEGFPNVVGEALSAGLPVVAFDCTAGPSELIEDGKNGFLVDVFDFETFREKLKQLMKDEDLRSYLAANAPNSIANFSPENICEAYYQVLLQK